MHSRQHLTHSLLTEVAYTISTAPRSNTHQTVQSKVYTLFQQRIHTAYPSDILCFPHQDIPTSSKHPIWLISLDPFHHEQAHQSNRFSISIAIAQCGELHCAFVYDVAAHKLYHAQKGGGAFLNEKLLWREELMQLREAEIRIDSSYLLKAQPLHPKYERVRSAVWSTSLEICSMAEGDTDIFIATKQPPHAFAVASLIALEAGVRIITTEGEQVDWSKQSSLWCGVV